MITSVIKRPKWSVNVYKVDDLLDLNSANLQNPLFRINETFIRFSKNYKSVIADPFLINFQDALYIFYEQKNDFGHGKIAAQQLLPYQKDLGIVIDEDFHLSFPNIFERNGKLFIIPECYQSGNNLIFECVNFPYEWTKHTLDISVQLLDIAYLEIDQLIFLIGTDRKKNLRCFYAANFNDTFIEVKQIFTNLDQVRNAGTFYPSGNKMFRFSQTEKQVYGESIIINEVLSLNRKSYHEKKIKELKIRLPEFAIGNHHISTCNYRGEQYIAIDGFCYDFIFNNFTLAIQKIYYKITHYFKN